MEEICTWKRVAANDVAKMLTGRGEITLYPPKPCYDCNGRNKECKKYTELK